MLDMLSGFAGIIFAWGVLGFILLPFAIYLEYLSQVYIRYATDGEVKITRRLSDKLGDNFFWRYYNMEPTRYGVLYLIVCISVVINLAHSSKIDMTIQEVLINAFFGMWVTLGAFAWPIVMLGIVLWLPTFLSRKVFRLKRKFERHVTNKNAHQ